MKRIISIGVVALLTLSLTVFGHGNMDHSMGTVTKIARNVVNVERMERARRWFLPPDTLMGAKQTFAAPREGL